METFGPDHWDEYNAAQSTRRIRPLCEQVMALAGPGAGRVALDLGCGAGRETDALLRDGWRVHAVDGAPGTADLVRRTTGGAPRERLTVHASAMADLPDLPAADLVHAAYSLPYLPPGDFAAVWERVRSGLRPDGWVAVNLFGAHDSLAATHEGTYLTPRAARALFDGLTTVTFDEQEYDGQAFGGTKHWHLFDVIARRPR